jgi:hypothetical protein
MYLFVIFNDVGRNSDYVTSKDVNIRSQDLNQLAASQLELPRKRSGTG